MAETEIGRPGASWADAGHLLELALLGEGELREELLDELLSLLEGWVFLDDAGLASGSADAGELSGLVAGEDSGGGAG